jgi:hypothetical protein
MRGRWVCELRRQPESGNNFLELACSRGAFHQLYENVVQRGKDLIERRDAGVLVQVMTQYIVWRASFLDPDRQGMIVVRTNDLERFCRGVEGLAVEPNAEKVLLELLLHILNGAIQDLLAPVYKHDMIADLFYLFHAMGTEDHRGAVLGQVKDLFFDDVAVHGVESTKGFIEYDQLWLVNDSSYELQLL